MARQAARREATREQLFSAASLLFQARGFETTTVDDIVREADVAKGTFYYHFKSKEELVVVMARLQLGDCITAMQTSIEAGQPPLDALRAFICDAAAAAEHNREISRIFLSLSLREPPPTVDGSKLPSFREAAAYGVAAAQAVGDIRTDRSAGELGGYLGALFLAAEVAWLMDATGDSLVARADRAFTFFLEGAIAR